jgi:acyl-CoA reductase-like NAD-dependent aldehyde dehydrogenase
MALVYLAGDALPRTARLPALVRRDVLRAISEGITARADALARTITLEAGKPISFSRSEVDRSAVTFARGAERDTRRRRGGGWAAGARSMGKRRFFSKPLGDRGAIAGRWGQSQ